MNSSLKIRPSRTVGAFTLIEVMVSIAIFALLVAAVYSTWTVILKSAQAGQTAAARVQRERIAIRTLEDSLTCIQSFQASMGYYTFNVTNGQQPGLSFVARLPEIFPRNGKFDANLRRLTFSVEPTGTDSERDLVLRQNPILMDQDTDEQQVPLVLARNVKDFIIECWDTNSYDWVDEWDSTNSLPPMVRITLTLTLGDKDNNNSPAPVFTATREIAIPSNTLPTVAQTGSPNGGGGGAGGGGIGNGGRRNNNGQNGNGPGGKNNGSYQPGGGRPGGFGNPGNPSGNPR